MKKSVVILCAVLFVFGISLLTASFVCSPAEAAMVVIEPDMFPVGTNVTNLIEGVTINTFSHLSGTITFGPVYVTSNTGIYGPAPTGTRLFANESDGINFSFANNAASCWSSLCAGQTCKSSFTNPFNAMIVQLENPTNYFEIAASWWSDATEISAYDASNQRIGWCNTYGPCSGAASYSIWQYPSNENTGATIGTLQVGSPGSEIDPFIQTIIIGGWEGNARLDRIRVAVPEPGTMILLGLGLVGVAGLRKRFHA